jgi:hypothetical protein
MPERYVVIDGDGIHKTQFKSDGNHEVYLYGGLQYDVSFYCRNAEDLGVWITYTDGYRTMVDNGVSASGTATLRTYNFVNYDKSRIISGLFFGWSRPPGSTGTISKWAEIDVIDMHVSNVGGNSLIPNGNGVGATDWLNPTSGLAQYWTSGGTGTVSMSFQVKNDGLNGFNFGNYQYISASLTGECTCAIYSQFTG